MAPDFTWSMIDLDRTQCAIAKGYRPDRQHGEQQQNWGPEPDLVKPVYELQVKALIVPASALGGRSCAELRAVRLHRQR